MEYKQEFFSFIKNNIDRDCTKLLLKSQHQFEKDLFKFAVLQIELRNKFKKKFPDLIKEEKFLFPDRSVAEQASGEAVSNYIAQLIRGNERVLDLTAGLGISTIQFSQVGNRVLAIEMDTHRANILRHNLDSLNIRNVDVVNDDCINWLEKNKEYFDVAYIDPSRRDKEGNRYISLHSYSPDIISILSKLKGSCGRLFIKVSPLLDIAYLWNTVPGITAIHLLEHRGELKELIVELDLKKDNSGSSNYIYCVDIKGGTEFHILKYGNIVSGIRSDDCKYLSVHDIMSGGYVYIPKVSLRKARLEKSLLNDFEDLYLLSPNTMLFYSPHCHLDFPGKILWIDMLLSKKELKRMSGQNCNVISRNYPLSSEKLTKAYNLIPSGNDYLIATTLADKTKILIKSILQ